MCRIPFIACIAVGFAFGCAIPPSWGQDSGSRSAVDFERDVRHVLKERCFACHGALKQESDLRVDTVQAMKESGVIVGGSPEQSELMTRVSTLDASRKMPPEGAPLTPGQIEAIATWIAQGATPSIDDVPEADPREHWAFRVPNRPAVPILVAGYQPANPIDAFLLDTMHRAGCEPRPIADRATRLRRVMLDLVGVPPSEAELAAFLTDDSEDAYERIVAGLLSSPLYGERWGRHWMDVWRYADWFGRRSVPDVWNSAPQIWRWRDWIVQSLNANKGYDQMVREMIAADEICPEDASASVATGYLIRNWYALNPNDWMRSVVEHTNKAFLGLTVQCAHCHDHKYDPISQEEYFQMRAFFEPMYVRQDRVAGQPDPGLFQNYDYSVQRKVQRLGLVRVFDSHPEAATWFYTGGDERNRQSDRNSIPPGVPAFLKDAMKSPIESITLPPPAWYPGLRPDIQQSMQDELTIALQTAQQQLEVALQAQLASHGSTAQKTQEAQRTQEAEGAQEAEKTSKALEQLALAEQAYEAAMVESNRQGNSGPLHGMQSLQLEAAEGRRMIFHALDGLESIDEGDTLEFDVRVLSDAHFNFQLTRDSASGLTATFVGFENGQVKSFKPGTFNEFQVGAFLREKGQDHFRVRLKFDRVNDQCWLTVNSVGDAQPIADNIAIALHGWNPAVNPAQGILFDARPGAQAVIDRWLIRRGEGGTILKQFDFEEPEYPTDSDVAGVSGWQVAATYCVAPATSKIVRSIPDPRVVMARRQLASARRVAARRELQIAAAKSRVVAVESQLADLQTRIQAEHARYQSVNSSPEERSRSEHAASLAQRTMKRHVAEALARSTEYELAEAEAQLGSEIDTEKKIASAMERWSKANSEWNTLQAQSEDPTALDYEPLTHQYPRTSTGRRRALADWMIDRKNPLAARVAVNHIWMRHFNKPLVPSVFDFGRNGSPPSHPELLDWLACEWMDSDWDMKRIHALMVTSDAYQRESSVADSRAATIDPENRFLWRVNTGRMESEVLRDSILHLARRLNYTQGGQELENSQSLTTYRRSLYYCCQPEDDGKSPLGLLFDGPDASECYRRTRTVVPQQSLALTNSEWVHDMSLAIQEQLDGASRAESQSDAEFVDHSFRWILNRLPRENERSVCEEFLRTQTESPRAALIRVLLNHSDFITIR